MPHSVEEPTATLGHDPQLVRERLRQAGLQLFSEHGYANTSIRQIAAAAQANVAAVSYYFGDKAGLYRAVFCDSPHPARDASGALVHSLPEMFSCFLAPLKEGDIARMRIKLYRREMLEPTGLWREKIDQELRPMHGAVVALLCRRLGLVQPDDDVHRLAICITGLAVHLFICCDVIDLLAPQLSSRPDAMDAWRDRLMLYAEAMIGAESQRRAACPATAARNAEPGALRAARRPRKDPRPAGPRP